MYDEHAVEAGRQLLRFGALRAVLAAAIERLLLLDRLLMVHEAGERVAGPASLRAALVSLFDPSLSPRNMALVACIESGDPSE